MLHWAPALAPSPSGASAAVPEWPYLGARTASLDPAGAPARQRCPPMLTATAQGTWAKALGTIGARA
eukprot:15017655-Alexandrium_andersonii.AAC.1